MAGCPSPAAATLRASGCCLPLPASTAALSPAAAPPSAPSASPTPAASSNRGMGAVLVVDDQAVNRVVLGRMVRKAGLDVVEATNGAECLDQLRSHPPGRFSCILMDLQMPIMDGWEATEQVRLWEAHAGEWHHPQSLALPSESVADPPSAGSFLLDHPTAMPTLAGGPDGPTALVERRSTASLGLSRSLTAIWALAPSPAPTAPAALPQPPAESRASLLVETEAHDPLAGMDLLDTDMSMEEGNNTAETADEDDDAEGGSEVLCGPCGDALVVGGDGQRPGGPEASSALLCMEGTAIDAGMLRPDGGCGSGGSSGAVYTAGPLHPHRIPIVACTTECLDAPPRLLLRSRASPPGATGAMLDPLHITAASHALSCGVDECVRKPMSYHQLCDILDRYIPGHAATHPPLQLHAMPAPASGGSSIPAVSNPSSPAEAR